MPSSNPYQLNQILWLIIETKPKSILDIGVGFGKYGFLAREYLELYDGREKYNDWQINIEGIEAFKEYLTPVHDLIYDKIHIGNASQILPGFNKTYDLILLIDVLEHFDYEQGMRLLDECRKKAKNILISTPKIFGLQEDSFGNPFEVHKFQYKKKHFKQFKDRCFVPNQRSLICYLGRNAKRFRRAVFNQRIKKCCPFLKYPF